jgi:hypothetical protein
MHTSTTNYSAVGVVTVEPLVEDSYLPSILSSILLSPSCSPSFLASFPVLGNRAYQNSGDPLIINPICCSSSSSSCSYAYTLERGSRFECP